MILLQGKDYITCLQIELWNKKFFFREKAEKLSEEEIQERAKSFIPNLLILISVKMTRNIFCKNTGLTTEVNNTAD
jgi:hypothetical protein